MSYYCFPFFFFFNDTATTEIYTLSLHDALPISGAGPGAHRTAAGEAGTEGDHNSTRRQGGQRRRTRGVDHRMRSEEHTSELQSHLNLVCRLLLEKKKKERTTLNYSGMIRTHGAN